ncbi:SRPBCC family protein [Chloroflexota bacterium]
MSDDKVTIEVDVANGSIIGGLGITNFTTAPLRLVQSVWLKVSQEKIFFIVSNPQEWSRLFPWVQSVTVDSRQAEVEGGVGARRCCNFGNGMVLEETIVAWNPPHMYAYSCQDETNPFGLKDHLGLVTCQADAEAGTILTWRQYFAHPNPQAMVEKMDGSLSMAILKLINRFNGRLLETYSNIKS